MGKVKSLGQVSHDVFGERIKLITEWDECDKEYVDAVEASVNAVIREYLKRQKAKKSRGKK